MTAILAAITFSPLLAAAPDVGLVTSLSGEVTYWNPAEKQPPAKAQAFLKVRRGDHFKVPEGAVAQLTYFASGRQETWKGPVRLHVGDSESQPAGNQKPRFAPEVKVLSSKVAKKMVSAPMVVARSGAQTSGVSQVMRETRSSGVIQTMAPRRAPLAPTPPGPLSPQAQIEVNEAEKVYQDLKKQAKTGDLTPEIYLFSVYAEHGQYAKIEQVIDTLLAKQPGDQTLKELKAWARSQAPGK
jgi:hypothetical protein